MSGGSAASGSGSGLSDLLPHSGGSPENYFSLDDILATQERIPITTRVDLPQLGFLDSSTVHQSDPTLLPAQTKLQLPYWMVKALKGKGPVTRIEVELPQTWSSTQRRIISAGPAVVDLNRLAPYFYESGRHLMSLVRDHRDCEDVGAVLVETLTKRFRKIADASANADARDTLVNTESLDQLERGLYQQGQRSMRRQEDWCKRRTGHMHTAAMVQRHRKLKRKADVLSN